MANAAHYPFFGWRTCLYMEVDPGVFKTYFSSRWALMALATLGLLGASCSTAGTQLEAGAGDNGAVVAGITTTPSGPEESLPDSTTQPSSEDSTTSSTSKPEPKSEPTREVTAAVEAPARAATGVDVPILFFGEAIELVQPDGASLLIQRDEAVRVAGDTTGGVIFQRELQPGARSSILWQPDAGTSPVALLIPANNQTAELHGVTTVNGVPEAVFSVTSEESSNRSLNRIDLATSTVVELRVVDDDEFGSKKTQVDGLFIVTTWARPNAAGWSVYQSGTGREIGGSTVEIEAACADGVGASCAVLASLSLDIETVFRVLPNHSDNHPGHYDLALSRSDNGSIITRIDLSTEDGEWYPEHLSELSDGKVLLSRSFDPQGLEPMRALVIDPQAGSFELLPEAGFVRLP